MDTILLICEGLSNRAGIERMTVELANLLSENYSVRIVVINSFSYKTCPFELKKEVNVTSLDKTFNKSLICLNIPIIKDLRKIFKTQNPKAVITVATPLVRLTAPACFGLGIKNIAWEHFNIFAGSKIGTLFKIAAPWFVDKTVVLTKQDEHDYKNFMTPRVITIPNFTNIGINPPSKCDNKILLAVGRHAPQKGFDLLIKAWAQTSAPGWKLRIVGSGADKSKNEQLAVSLNVFDRIDFIEAHPNIAHEFQNSSCFVLSSRFEGLVLVLIEAKMMGLPCISFDCPNSPKEVIRNNIDGILIPPENIEEMANALTKTLKDTATLKKMGEEARKDAINRYSVNAVKNQWLTLINS